MEIVHAAGVQTKWVLDVVDGSSEDSHLVESLVDIERFIIDTMDDRMDRVAKSVHTLHGRDYCLDDGSHVRFRWRPLIFDWRCLECGTDTDALDEYYMVDDAVWAQVTDSPEGHLCIGCLEDRLGRRLVAADFTDSPVNSSDQLARSDRLRSRLTARDR